MNDGTHNTAYSKVIDEFGSVVKYVSVSSSRGPAHARNVGARESDAEYVVFTDDDCSPPSHWLDWLVARIETAPDADVIGGTAIPCESRRRRASVIERYNRALRFYPRPLFFRGEMHCLPTANVAVKRAAFVQSGGFDEYFRFPAGEDTEFFYRMRYLGFRFLIDPLWRTEHPIADSLRTFLRRHYRYGYGNAQHRIRTGDPFGNGVPANLTVWRIIQELPAHVRGCQAQLAGRAERDESSPRASWSASFTVLAVAQRLAYRYGGYKAYRTEGLGLLAGPPPKLKTPRANAAAVLAGATKKPHIPLFGLIIGAMKCGTSALFKALHSHPQIVASHIKEPRFFFDDREFAKGQNWYRDLFDFEPNRHAIAMEASVRNAMRPAFEGCANRMLKTGWAFRFVYIVRNPIERIQSHYLHAAAAKLGLPPLAAGVHRLVIDISRYHWQLAPYRELFGRSSILVIPHEDWVAAPDDTLRQVCRHFGIDLDRVGRSQTIHSSEYHYRRQLVILELKKLGLAPPKISLDMVPQVMADLRHRIRSKIETTVEAHYRLTRAQVKTVRQALSEDMRRLRKDYRIEVSRWGFDV